MSLFMFFDTETTGKWDFKSAWNAPHQPNLVQLGFKVVRPEKRQVVFETGMIVDCTAFPTWKGIEPDAEDVHHISEADVREWGHHYSKAAVKFNWWAQRCNLFIAHNCDFDYMIMQGFMTKAEFGPEWAPADAKLFCTMKSTTQICKIPSPKGPGYKWPKLIEAYKALVDRNGFKGAHNALADVNACEAIFWSLVDSEIIKIGDFNAPTS